MGGASGAIDGTREIRVTVVTKALSHPWGMAWLPNGDLLVSERPGRLRIVRNGVLDPTPISGLPPGIRPEDNETGTRQALAKLAALVEGSSTRGPQIICE